MVVPLLVVAVPGTSARETESFSATVDPDGPLVVDALVQTVPTYDFWANVTVPPVASEEGLLVFHAEEATVHLYDVSSGRVRHGRWLSGQDEPNGHLYVRPVVFLETARSGAQWEVFTRGARPTELASGGQGPCELEREPVATSPFHGVPVEERATAADLAQWLQITCLSAPFNVTGDHALYVTDATLRIEFDNGTGPAGEPRRSSERIESGPYSTDPLVPAWQRELQRVVRFTTPDPAARLAFETPTPVRMQAPRLLTVGHLAMPSGNGSVSWGDSHWPGPSVDPMAVEGAFLFAPSGMEQITIDGQAFRPEVGPPMAPVAPSGPTDWSLAVASLGLLALLLARPWALLAPLFTRLTQDRALDHERRRALLETVQNNPGLRVQDTARILRVHWSVVNYHAKVLARQGLLQRRRAGRETLLYVGHDLNPAKIEELRRLRHPTVQSLLEALDANPSQTQAELAAKIGVRQPRVSRLIGDLERLGVVRCERLGRGWAYRRVEGHGGPHGPAAAPVAASGGSAAGM